MTHFTEDREQSLFLLCLELPEGARVALLDAECKDDPDLHARMQRLLAAYASAEDATLNPLSGLGETETPDRVGPYRILAVLGEGGMGVVYEAEQEQPLQRRVALKILKPGLDTKRILQRFRHEQQSLAALDHPYIAKVFDAGHTERGRPFFVMERVTGTPLDSYADAHQLSLPQRIFLFIRVCEAVQHAHQKGIIHRDLKPSNILVTHADGEVGDGIPKVIDFGIAKAISSNREQNETHFTEVGQILGTPAYMAPEQAAMGRQDVDTRADVYALGVVLYQLLCGELPTDPGKDGMPAHLTSLARGELLPPLPSARLHGDHFGAATIASRRGLSVQALKRALCGDLDAIVLRALEPLREHRYPTVAALADDLRRHLQGEPVTARPATTAYRMQRYLRRHRAQAVAIAAVALSLVTGTVASAFGYLRAAEAERQARLEAQTATQISDFVVNLFTLADPSEARGNSVTVREVLERGERSVETDLAGQPALQARIFSTLGRVNYSLGRYARASTLAAAATSKHQEADDAESLDLAQTALVEAKALFRQNRLDDAERSARRALNIRRQQLGPQDQAVAEVLNELGAIYWVRDRFPEARRHHQEALAIYRAIDRDHVGVAASLRGLGIVATSEDQYAQALELHQQALPRYQRHLGAESMRVADTQDSIGLALQGLKRNEEALTHMRQALALRTRILGPDHEILGYSLHNIGRLLASMGRKQEALDYYQRGLALRERALGKEHPLTALLLESIGIYLMENGQVQDGLPLIERSLAINRKALGESHLETLESHRNLVIANLLAKRYPRAIAHLDELLSHNPPSSLRVDLDDKDLAPLHAYPRFAALRKRFESVADAEIP